MIVQPWCVKEDHSWVRFNELFDFCTLWNCQKIIDCLMVLGELNWFAWTRFVWFRCSWGVPLVLRWYSVGILGCSAGVPGNVQLFRHCSGVLCCFSVPSFIVCHPQSRQHVTIELVSATQSTHESKYSHYKFLLTKILFILHHRDA